MIDLIRRDLKEISDSKRAIILQRFFKTGEGEYAEGDIFLGITVPQSRKIAIKYKDLSLGDIGVFLKSEIHEERLIALLILVHNFKLGSASDKERIFNYYLQNTKYINNWDLVDLSADKILGEHLVHSLPHVSNDAKLNARGPAAPHPHPTSSVDKLPAGARRGSPSRITPRILIDLSRSNNPWERRIAILATLAFIKRGECDITFEIAEKLLEDRNDLIQKAVGWMLREAGKKCGVEFEEEFLVRNYKKIGRTCLRYAIERFPEKKRKEYLLGKV